MGSLFEAVQGFVELINEIILIRLKITKYLFNINFFSEGPVEKGGFDTELIDVKI